MLLSFSTPQALANQTEPEVPTVKCPTIGEEYQALVSKLETIKASIKESGNCKNVVLQVDSLQKLIGADRSKVLEIINRANGASLSVDDAAFVKQYAEGLTMKVASLNDLFLNSNQCFQEGAKGNQLMSLAGFVGEASNLIGSVSGPWGTPIALAGNLVAGFLTGLDAVLKTRAGYDFSDRNQWSNYVQNLCTYHSFRGQIEHLLNPEQKLQELTNLGGVLESQLQTLRVRCEECRLIEANFGDDRLTQPAVIAANSKNPAPYGSYTLQSLGLQRWLKAETSRLQREIKGDWGNASGQYILTRAQEEIEDFLILREAPKFLAFQTQQASVDFDQFRQFVDGEGYGVYQMIARQNPNALLKSDSWFTPPLFYFEALVLNPVQWNLLPENATTEENRYSWNHFRTRSRLELRKSETTARVALSFCAFFKRTNQYSTGIRSVCSGTQFSDLIVQYTTLEEKLRAREGSSQGGVGGGFGEFNLNDKRDFAKSSIEVLRKKLESRPIH